MNRELAEVRRYWPMAKRYRVGNYSAVRNWRKWYAALFPCDDDGWDISVGEVDGTTRYHHAPTISAAMRAAGFGMRPLGGFARQRQIRLSARRQSAAMWGFPATLTGDDPVKLDTRQRPRNGVRLGKRKRRGADKEDARQFAQWREAQP